MNAARDLQRSTGANVVEVFLELSPLLSGKGYSLGVARFAPDGKGFSGYEQWKWEVQATDIQISQQEIAIAELWWQNRDSFQTRNGTTDEQRLSKFIANKLHISPSQVHLPLTLINWRDYPVAQ
ncbi:MAG: hypothetical protein AUG51_16885 [Acidobacteria bacterium 13_1_20CM_3_53_8]|nr:MAG: hypothetical protein AUG51_16885 [Acidobacteria bacterium 13_1_20CM_3_53_8]